MFSGEETAVGSFGGKSAASLESEGTVLVDLLGNDDS